jgi:hypothetical protein
MVNAITYSVVRYKLIPFFKNEDTFENLVYIFCLMLLLTNFVCVPVCAWFDAPKAVEYLEKWKMFQVCADAVNYFGAWISLQIQTWLVIHSYYGKEGETVHRLQSPPLLPYIPLMRFIISSFLILLSVR